MNSSPDSGTNRDRWLKPCDAAHCAKVFIGEDRVFLASTLDSGSLAFTHEEWAQFLTAVKRGDFDL